MKSTMLAALALCLAAPFSAQAQQKAHPPQARFWMDAATHHLSISGMDEMADNPMLAGMMGGSFGQARHGMGMPGKWLDSALHTRAKPNGTEGAHGIPDAMRLSSPLPLLPVAASASAGTPGEQEEFEKPKGRFLFYWGCSATARPGQPRVLDLEKTPPQEFGRFMTGRHAPDRGAKAVPGRSIWPNRNDSRRLPRDASLLGEHSVAGEGVPAGWRFAVPAGFDFMDRVQMSAAGDPGAAIPVRWEPVATATGYFLTAIGHRQAPDGVPETVFWSSSESPDPGWGLMDYLAPSRVDKLVKEKVVLPKEARKCDLPAGAFARTEGAMVRLIAYGPELNLAHPPRPADPKIEWKPEWTVLLRLKSTGMALLGEEAAAPAGNAPAAGERKAAPTAIDAIKEEVGNPVNILRGIFGR